MMIEKMLTLNAAIIYDMYLIAQNELIECNIGKEPGNTD